MIKRIFFETALILFASLSVFSLTQAEIEEFQDSWNSQKNEFLKSEVRQCAGNENNTLFLMAADNVDGGHSVVWAFHAGEYNKDNRIKPIWDKLSLSCNSIKSLVFSPFSNKFYFSSAWAVYDSPEKNTQGLYILNQTHSETPPYITLDHHLMEVGEGCLLVNKTGVWLLHDVFNGDASFQSSRLYKIEDEKGNFVFQINPATEKTDFLSFYNYEHNTKKDKAIIVKFIQDGVFQSTDYTLLLCDKDGASWWLYNCVNKKLKKYESYWTAKKKALLIDKRYELGIWPNLNRRNALQIILQIIELICFIFTPSILIIKLVHKIKHDKNTSTILKERNKMIFDIQEKERAKISRDIHDSVVQDIRVLRLETENLVVDEKSKARQTKIADLATDCIIKLRNICYNLTPAELANHNTGDSSKLELISIINSLVQQFSSRTHIPCVFKVEEGFEYPVLEKEKTQNLFRVIQESLTNIEKHSYATQASIFLKKDGNTLFIYITDDGIGCNPNELDKKLKSKEHLGLRSMKDRMELIGGSIDFFTSQNDGMEIKIELPLEDAK